MSIDNKIIYAIEKHKNRLLGVIIDIRQDIGEDILEIEFTKHSEEAEAIERWFPDLAEIAQPDYAQIDDIRNHLTAVYVVSFLTQLLTSTIEDGEAVDSVLVAVSDSGAVDGMEYARYGTKGAH